MFQSIALSRYFNGEILTKDQIVELYYGRLSTYRILTEFNITTENKSWNNTITRNRLRIDIQME